MSPVDAMLASGLIGAWAACFYLAWVVDRLRAEMRRKKGS